MPPKRLQLVQSIRDALPEEVSAGVVEHWATEVLPRLDTYASAARELRRGVAGTAASAEATPSAIVDALSQYQDIAHDVYTGAEVIRSVILCRIPEFKLEDNLGVEVQMTFVKLLDNLQSRLQGSAGDDKGAAAPTASMFALRNYLASRAAVEDKLLGKPADEAKEKDGKAASGGSKAPSAPQELRQVDVDALMKAELAAVTLGSQLRALITAYGLNWKKLIQPRVSGDRMVS